MRGSRLWSLAAVSAAMLVAAGVLTAAAQVSAPVPRQAAHVLHHVVYEVNVLRGDTTSGVALLDYLDPRTGGEVAVPLGSPFAWRLDVDTTAARGLDVRVVDYGGPVLGCVITVDDAQVARSATDLNGVGECSSITVGSSEV